MKLTQITRKKLALACATASTSIAIIATGAAGCAKPLDRGNQDFNSHGGQISEENWRPVRGQAAYGSQCPAGYFSNPKPAELDASCNVAMQEIVLTTPLRTFVLEADCGTKTIKVRTADRTVDEAYNVFPDGYFDFNLDGGDAILESDVVGQKNCVSPMTANVWGFLHCNGGANDPNRDKVNIDVNTNWVMNEVWNPPPAPSPTPTNPNSNPGPQPTTIVNVPSTINVPMPVLPVPIVSGSPRPTTTPSPSPTISPSPSPIPRPQSSASPTPARPPRDITAGPRCVLAPGCKLVSSATINQCQ